MIVAGIIALIVIILLCVFILYKIQEEKSLANTEKRNTFSILLVWIILWSVSILVTEVFYKHLEIALWASRISFFTSAFVAYWFYLFVRTYKKAKITWLGKVLWGVVAVSFACLSLTDKLVKSVSLADGALQSVRGDFHILFAVYTGILFCFSAILFFTAYKKEENLVTKSQIFYIFTGSMLSIISSFVTNLLLPMLDFKEIRALGPLSLVFFILTTYYAILRYRFPSTRLIVSRVVYFLIISSLPFAIFHLVAFIQNSTWGSIYEPEAMLTGYIYSGVFVFLYSLTSRGLDSKLKRMFSDYKIDIQSEKEKLIMNFNDSLDAKNILQGAKDLLQKVFNSNINIIISSKGKQIKELEEFGIKDLTEVDLNILREISQPLVRDELLHVEGMQGIKSVLDKYKITVFFPIITSKLIDWDIYIAIEESKNSKSYSIQDLDHIRSIGSSMAIALQRAYLYLEVETFNKSLQEKVNEQTKELQVKIKELEEARKKEADMIDIMGHELRTPATVVKLNAELLEKFVGSNPADFKKYLDRIKDSVQTEIGLINTLLTSAKLEGDKVEIQAGKVDIKAEIDMAMHGHEVDLKEKGLEFVNRVDTNTPEVYADKVRVVEVLNNLVSNGIKYTEKGSITITTEYDDKFVKISIQDTGKGIPKENLEKLGGKFYRIDNYLGSEIVRPGGTGLGLYVTFGLVKLMGGDIWVESEVGKGSKFTFTLPIYNGQVIKSSDSSNMFEKLGLKK